MGRPRVAALAAMGTQAIGDDEAAAINANSDAKAVGDAYSRVRSVVSERLGEPDLDCPGGWRLVYLRWLHRELNLLVSAPGR
ncbi:MAG TPA: hypothetical protein VKA05_07370 [Acidimicrobiales bacterium]|nr:hypothetical protein [Acidimicrobiales bacterium]